MVHAAPPLVLHRVRRMVSTCAILTMIAAIMQFGRVDCFQASRHIQPNMFRGSPFFAADENGNPDLATASGDPTNARKRRKRSADFPSFAYDTKRSRRQRGRTPVKFQDSSGKSEWVARTPAKPRNVSVPKREDEEEVGMSWFEKIFYAVIGSSYESGFIDITNSARKTRLLMERAYALPEPFSKENMDIPPSLDDLTIRPRQPFEGFWISTPARVLSFGGAYTVFPLLTKFLDRFVTMQPEQLDDITSKFAPGISILYGTFVSLTLSILYTRQRDIQDNVALECAYLVIITRNLLSIFKNNRDMAIEAGQCAADQIRTLVRSSRGAELILLMYNDPYARMAELLEAQEEHLFYELGSYGRSANLLSNSRDILKDLNRIRANRLSDEALALPPTHFLILNFLTLLILLGYTISILPTTDFHTGEVSNESSVLFGVLSTIYVLFYNFCADLNNPFEGVYQIRRSCAASHLLEAKWLIVNHPLLRGEVDFEEVPEEPAGVLIRSPGLGDLWFERDEIYVDSEVQED